MKRVLILAALLLGLVVGAGPVAAAPPTQSGKPGVLFEGDLPAGSTCSFEVHVLQTGKEKIINLPGERITTASPGQKVTLTNNATGESTSYVITGSRHELTTNGITEVKVTGRNVALNFAGKSSKPGIFLLVGNFNFALRGDVEERLFSGAGQVTDVCAVLS